MVHCIVFPPHTQSSHLYLLAGGLNLLPCRLQPNQSKRRLRTTLPYPQSSRGPHTLHVAESPVGEPDPSSHRAFPTRGSRTGVAWRTSLLPVNESPPFGSRRIALRARLWGNTHIWSSWVLELWIFNLQKNYEYPPLTPCFFFLLILIDFSV